MLSKHNGTPSRRVKPRSWQEDVLLRHYQQSQRDLAEKLRRDGTLGKPGPVIFYDKMP